MASTPLADAISGFPPYAYTSGSTCIGSVQIERQCGFGGFRHRRSPDIVFAHFAGK